MGQRPSQCPECGCFQFCLFPGATYCAERDTTVPTYPREETDDTDRKH